MPIAKGAEIVIPSDSQSGQRQRFTRAKRPGQRPPQPGEGSTSRQRTAEGGAAAGGGCGSGTAAGSNTYKEGKSREREKFDSKRPDQVKLFQSSFPVYQEQFSSAGALPGWQARIDKTFSQLCTVHPCCLSAGGIQQCVEVSYRTVQLIAEVHTVLRVEVPSGRCNGCSQWLEIEAYSLGAAPATPDMPGVWYSLPVLDFFRHINLLGGLSADGEYSHVLERPSVLLVRTCQRGLGSHPGSSSRCRHGPEPLRSRCRRLCLALPCQRRRPRCNRQRGAPPAPAER